jgi:general nucleoside transport system permease protein
LTVTVAVFSIGVTLMAPVLWAALGELITEQSGVLNVGVEGVMLIAAFAAGVGYRTGSYWLAILAALGSGIACGIVLAILYVRLGTDQIVTGILFNLFAVGLTTTLYQKYLGAGLTLVFPNLKIPKLGDIPWIGEILFHQNFLVYGAFLAAPAVFFLVYRTWFGLYARAASEHPRAAESAGLNVLRLRYPAVVVGCALAAIGGATLVLSVGQFVPGLTGGRGFIALAVVVLARWNPFGVILACLLFGVTESLQFETANLGPLAHVPSDFVLMIPYLATVLGVVFARGSRYPAACGIPYRPPGARA